MSRRVRHCFVFQARRVDLGGCKSKDEEQTRKSKPKRTPIPCWCAVSIARVILGHAPAKTCSKSRNGVLVSTDGSAPHR